MSTNIKSNLLAEKIRTQIIDGSFGNSGERFLSVRKLAAKYSVSLVTAQKIIKALSKSGVITLYGKAYFITTGKISPESQLQIRIENKHRGENKFIGIHIPKFNNPFFSALLNEIVKSVYNIGYSPVIMCSNQNPELEKSILEDFIKTGVCGVISCPNNSELLKGRYDNYPLPLVFLANHFSTDETDFAVVDNIACGKHVAQHLIEMEYKNFIYIGAESAKKTDKRGPSFIGALEKAGYTVPKENIIYLSDNENFTIPYSVAQHIKNCKKPLGIFCFHDIIAVGVVMLCEKLKLNIPKDIGVVGFDNLPIAKQCRPMISSISYRFGKMAEAAVNLLMQKINSEKDNKIKTKVFVNHSLKIRDSSRRKPL